MGERLLHKHVQATRDGLGRRLDVKARRVRYDHEIGEFVERATVVVECADAILLHHIDPGLHLQRVRQGRGAGANAVREWLEVATESSVKVPEVALPDAAEPD